MMTETNKTVTILVPTFNEEENVERCYQQLCECLTPVQDRYQFEFLFVDNHSVDRTYEILKKIASADERVRVIRYSKNFGFQCSVYTGYTMARGDALVQIDADLQDPPEVILQFLEKWEEGYQVVYGVRQNRKEGRIINFLRHAFYVLIDKLADDHLPHDSGDFRLVDRVILDEIIRSDDHQPYLRGMIAEMGFNQTGVAFDRQARAYGESKFKPRQLLGFALDGILYHSVVPLRLATLTGLAITIATLLMIIFYATGKVFFGSDWPRGFATTTVLILLGIALNALFLGIIGEYLARLYQQTKRRATAIVESSINDKNDDNAANR
jgi:polyisoprenyl-phosphate glycosyltransferase